MSTSDRNWFVAVKATQDVILDLGFLKPELTFCEVESAWLNQPGDDRTAITAPEWDGLDDVQAVRSAAKELLAAANSALRADSPLHPELEFGGIVWRRDAASPRGAQRHFSLVLESTVIALTGFAVGMSTARSGYQTYPPRTKGVRQMELAAADTNFAAAVRQFEGAGEDLRALYIVYEYVTKRARLKRHLYASRAELTDFKTTANNAEHVRHVGGDRPVSRMVSGAEARDLMRRLLDGWLDAKNPF